MAFIASKILWVLLQPALLFSCLLLITGIAALMRWQRLLRLLVLVQTAIILFVMLVPVGGYAIHVLQAPWQPVKDDALPAHVDGIVVLGGATANKHSHAWGQPVVGDSAERLFAFIKLTRLYPEAKAAFLGGNGLLESVPVSEADIARQLFDDTGADVDKIIFEHRSRNTRENAVYGKELLQPKPGETWLLITSAYHMSRATLVFEALDWPVTAYPVDFQGMPHFRWNLSVNAVSRIYKLGSALHEWAGLVYYHLQGWTRSLVPQ